MADPLPTYDVGGTQKTAAFNAPRANANQFGAGIGGALKGVGQQLQQQGNAFLDKSLAEIKKVEETEKATRVMEAYTEGSDRLRETMYNPDGGLMNRTGKNAAGVYEEAAKTSSEIRDDIRGRFATDEERTAFDRMWSRKDQSTKDSTIKHQFNQAKKYNSEQRASSLASLQADVVAGYNDPEAIKGALDAAKAIINLNSDGMSPEGVARLNREVESSFHVSVIQRMTQDNPGDALDYYKSVKDKVSGADHATVNKFISGVKRARDARSAAKEIYSGGVSAGIIRAVRQTESGGDPSAVSPVGAAGGMQLMPDTAREVAVGLGMTEVAQMSDKELRAFWATPEGDKINERLGTAYLGQQLKAFGGDLEAALIAYNAGPGNARKWLDAGRDYSALPKRSETEPYVAKVLKAYKGIDVSHGRGEGSGKVQTAIASGKALFTGGDAREYLISRLTPGKNSSHIKTLTPVMADRTAALFDAAPDYVKAGLGVLSAGRSPAYQANIIARNAKKYGFSKSAWLKDVKSLGPIAAGQKWGAKFSKLGMRKWIALPGGSKHQKGVALDLGWNGGKFSGAPAKVRKWVHANAESFGLTFPMGHEPWHIETVEARSKGKLKDGTVVDARKINPSRFGDGNDEATPGQTIEPSTTIQSAAELYTNVNSPYTVNADGGGDINVMLEQARERYADNPSMLAEVERQITQDYNIGVAQNKAETKKLASEMMRAVMDGTPVGELDPLKLQTLGATEVNKLLTLEKKFGGGDDDKTDDMAYYKLSKMSDEEFQNVDLMSYADRLSGADLRKLADKQKEMSAPEAAGKRSTDLTRTQIMNNAENILGLDPNKKPEDAETMVALERAMNEKIQAFISANNGREPTGDEMQAMADQLMLQGNVAVNWGLDKDKRLFELTPEEAADFFVEGRTAEGFGDIPKEALPKVAKTYAKIFRADPDETQALDLYNDVVRITMGATPEPPDVIRKRIEQGLLQRLGRRATPEEVANTYRAAVVRASKE